MLPMHPAKRRRTDCAASTLTKPFRPPRFVKPEENKTVPTGTHNQQKPPQPLDATETNTTRLTHITSFSPLPSVELSSSYIEQYGSSEAVSFSQSKQSPHVATIYDSEHAALSKQRRDLALQLRTVSAAVDTTSQALNIIRAKQSDDLETCIDRWRTIARNVADYMFLAIKSHASDLGGMAACYEMYSTSPKSSPLRETSETDATRLTNEQKELLKIAHEEVRIEAEKYGMYQPQELSVNMYGNSMTMDLMLRQLNIDVGVIGYDVRAEQWVD